MVGACFKSFLYVLAKKQNIKFNLFVQMCFRGNLLHICGQILSIRQMYDLWTSGDLLDCATTLHIIDIK